MSVINITNLSHQNGDKILYRDVNLQINRGEHVALIGPNGTGKTTLLNLIANSATKLPDRGEIKFYPKIKLGYLDQHQNLNQEEKVSAYLEDAFKDLYDLENKINRAYELIADVYDEDILTKALAWQETLNNSGFYQIDKEIGNLVNGLGIDANNLNKTLGELSSGQKGKIILTKLLLKKSDFMLLDEPTNFLDIQQIEWLAKFLQNYENAFLVVSHDINFLNQISEIIYAIEHQTINRYVGNYEKYLELSALKDAQYEQERTKQQEKINKLKDYIARNIARASTASSAQSRKKQLNKINILEKHSQVTEPKIIFKYQRPQSAVVLDVKSLEIGYNSPLIKPLSFQLRDGQKWIIKGYNGVGKTTFLNTITGFIPAWSGQFNLHQGVITIYFDQLDSFEGYTPINYLMNKNPELLEHEARALLGKYGIKAQLMNNPLISLSGGEQTRIKLAALSFKAGNLLILDEPTNHLDALSKKALLKAIHEFPGAVLLTTHDMNFQTQWANKVLDFEEMTK